MKYRRILPLLAVVALITLYLTLDLGQYFTLENAQSRLAGWQDYARENFLLAAFTYMLAYILFTLLMLPGALLFTLLGGAVFGLFWGTVLVSFASSLGATAAFLISRTLLHDWVQRRFGDYLAPINRGIARDGAFYLFTIRMVPLSPFFMVNLLAGLTPIRVRDYYLATQSGMLLATIIFVNAGVELSRIQSLSGLISTPVLISLILLGVLPLVARLAVNSLRRERVRHQYRRPEHFAANVVVIGGGSAGLVASLLVAGARAKVVLVEQQRMGGDCLYTGCVPSKTLIRSARIADYVRRAGEFGVHAAAPAVDFTAVLNRVKSVIRRIEPHDSVERFTSLGVECVNGKARIVSPWCVEVDGRSITTRSIIVATGARPVVPDIPGLADIEYLTSETVWDLPALPQRLLILGGGPIGCELAQAFQQLGSTVTLVEQANQLLPSEDEDVSAVLMQKLRDDGVTVITGHRVVRFQRHGTEQTAIAEADSDSVGIGFDRILLALGRRANVAGFGLEELGLSLTSQGALEVNQYLQTSIPNIFACGDVVGSYQFTHMASYQAWFAALNAMLGGWKRFAVNYRVVPFAIFTSPEVARVGLNESDARSRGIKYELTRFSLDRLDRAVADQDTHGFIKVLTAPGSDRILGVSIIGRGADEMLGEYVLAMTHNLGLKKIAAATHVYPTLNEANRFVANAWRSARLPVKYFPLLEKYFSWQRRQK